MTTMLYQSHSPTSTDAELAIEPTHMEERR
jgi:hypothetical protein